MDISFVFVTFVANSKHLWHYVVLYGLISVSYTGISIPCDLILYYVYICSNILNSYFCETSS